MAAHHPSEDWFGTPKAAELLGISQRALYRLIDEGVIPAYKLGRVVRLRREHLERYLNERAKG